MDEIIPKCVVYVPNSIIYYYVFCNANLDFVCLAKVKHEYDTLNYHNRHCRKWVFLFGIWQMSI